MLRSRASSGVSIRGVVDRDIKDESYYSHTDSFISKIGKENIKTDYLCFQSFESNMATDKKNEGINI
ncbi:hypothetical protein KPL37_16180 [Clostridium frigoris]|uniref:Uncharacterized protein n=1 Tax=Clostridium frigoris TaxID=205327 RepID=A0ABS6BXC9_9CLOT|nr:hypothetical protein [Clostridium frigoris]MBU3161256.1 hypothetical protein [Clostridium frigoris]